MHEPLPKPEKPTDLRIYSADFHMPIRHVNTGSYPSGTTMRDFISWSENYGTPAATHLKQEPALSLENKSTEETPKVEILPSSTNVISIKKVLDRYNLQLSSDIISKLGSDPIKAIEDPSWQDKLPPGVWLNLPNISDVHRWVSGDHNLRKILETETVVIHENLLPHPTLLIQATISEIRRSLGTQALTIRNILQTMGNCESLLFRLGQQPDSSISTQH